ncbi:MAG: SMP-30/gluconolactonase/LRE family protein [Verrucomicrobia bacterium]|nr:SMP-30/gluconolactonase/LRE family protein [Verrucomicrobiota bacterium]MCH8511446.1 SMP-30/gluconolactonase/LRE family protein [Kiritimatiellia bacterium]
MKPLLDLHQHASVFCGGILHPQRLNHPEGLCVDSRDGSLWCGGEGGELYHVSADGGRIETVACTGGFLLGVTMDSRHRLYLCDLHHQAVFVYDDQGRQLAKLTSEGLVLPNFAVLSHDERFLYVSNTCRSGGPGIFRFELSTGKGTLWMSESCLSANGLALSPAGDALYLVESHLPGVTRVPILPDGRAGAKELFLALPGDEPDGLAFHPGGDLYISIYNPSKIYRWSFVRARLDLLIEDESTDLLHHPTNLAFRSPDELFSANLGAWHLTRVETPHSALPPPNSALA